MKLGLEHGFVLRSVCPRGLGSRLELGGLRPPRIRVIEDVNQVDPHAKGLGRRDREIDGSGAR